MNTQKNEARKKKFNKKSTVLRIVILILIIVSFSTLYLRCAWHRYQEAAVSEAKMLANSVAALIHPEEIEHLTGGEEDRMKPEYLRLQHELSELAHTKNRVRAAYLTAEREGGSIFLLDSEPGSSNAGGIFEQADDSRWTGIRVPVKDPADEMVLGYLGLVYSSSEWNDEIWEKMVPDIIIIVCLLALFAVFIHTWTQHLLLKDLSKKVEKNEILYHSVFDQVPVGIAIMNGSGFADSAELGQVNVNPMFEKILGRNSTELETMKWEEITHPQDLKEDLKKYSLFRDNLISGYSMEKRFLRPDGSEVWTNMTISPFLDRLGTEPLHICLVEDLSKRNEVTEALRESERRESVLLAHIPGLAYRCRFDRDGTMLYVSRGCLALTGYEPECFIENKELAFNDIITPPYRDLLWEEWQKTIPAKRPYNIEYEIRTADGRNKWVLEMGEGVYDEKGEVEALEGIILDISERRQAENLLRYASEHDRWSGLFNRHYLENLLENDAKMETGVSRALLGINMSGMQSLTSVYGFHYTQDLVKKTAQILGRFLSEEHLLFNVFENYFVFYLKGYQNRKELERFSRAVSEALDPLIRTERFSGGIGIVEINSENEQDIDRLLKNLLIASEKALDSEEPEIGFCYYDPLMQTELNREEDIKRELIQIAGKEEDGGLFLQFQPIWDIQSDRIFGFEALARLNMDKYGFVAPLEFIPIAEETKLIIPIGHKIFEQAFRFLKKLGEEGYTAVTVSVNVSAIQLLRADFADSLFRLMDQMEIDPKYVGIELTESIFTANWEEINLVLARLKSVGISIAIDDFGTGYSSLAKERELNVDCMKIDKYFIDKLLTLKPEEAITGDIISMAHKLGHTAVAEGVEKESQLAYLKEWGCDRAQGYLIGRPMREAESMEYLKNLNQGETNSHGS